MPGLFLLLFNEIPVFLGNDYNKFQDNFCGIEYLRQSYQTS